MSWKEEMRDSIRTLHDLSNFLENPIDVTNYPIFIPRSFAQRIKDAGKNSPLWNQFIPCHDENLDEGLYDPIGDSTHAKGGGIIQRYQNRVLFSPTMTCPINCRYCFRKNELSSKDPVLKADLSHALNYVESHPEVDEVILTGGDPLILDNRVLERIISSFNSIKHVKYIRLHSRTPVILPQRIDDGFIELTKKYSNLVLAIHINHTDEITDTLREKIKQLRCTLLSQTVLLKNVNDSASAIAQLMQELHGIGIRPYYLHHPDRVKGAMHFYMDLECGRTIYHELRKILPGWLIPHYVIDIPGGHGKTLAYNSERNSFSGKLKGLNGDYISIEKIEINRPNA
jgi:lysine 2,3-aminomutase